MEEKEEWVPISSFRKNRKKKRGNGGNGLGRMSIRYATRKAGNDHPSGHKRYKVLGMALGFGVSEYLRQRAARWYVNTYVVKHNDGDRFRLVGCSDKDNGGVVARRAAPRSRQWSIVVSTFGRLPLVRRPQVLHAVGSGIDKDGHGYVEFMLPTKDLMSEDRG